MVLKSWNAFGRWAARFACWFIFLSCAPGVLSSFLSLVPPVADWFGAHIWSLYGVVDTWVAIHVFHLSGPVTVAHPTGSGDTTLNYIEMFVMLAFAAVFAVLWSMISRLRRNDERVYPWVRLAARLYLAIILLSYGFSKVFPNQFPAPDLSRLIETYGESSPMGLLWTVMGASTAYQVFAGSLEALAGMLLLVKRTATIGALLGATVIVNIVAMNFCFDVPVKLFSTSLLVVCIFLLWDDVRPLWEFFVRRRPAQLGGNWVPPFENRWLQFAQRAAQVGIPLWFLWQTVPPERERYVAAHQSSAAFPTLRGLWAADGPAPAMWERVALDSGRRIAIWNRDGELLRFVVTPDAAKRTLKLRGWRNDHVAELLYEQRDNEHLMLTGTIDNEKVALTFKRVPVPKFLLTTRGFHWISEDPYNM